MSKLRWEYDGGWPLLGTWIGWIGWAGKVQTPPSDWLPGKVIDGRACQAQFTTTPSNATRTPISSLSPQYILRNTKGAFTSSSFNFQRRFTTVSRLVRFPSRILPALRP